MSENIKNQEVKEELNTEALETKQEEVKGITLPAAVLPIAAGLMLDGLYHVGSAIIKFSIKMGKQIAKNLKKNKVESPEEPKGFLEYEGPKDE